RLEVWESLTAAESVLSHQPLVDAADGILARLRIGADMNTPSAVGTEGEAGQHAHGVVGTIEFMVGARVDYDRGACAAAARTRHHLLADRRRRPIVGTANQNHGRNARTPCGLAQPLTARIKRDDGSEIRQAVTRHRTRPRRP